VSNSADVHLPRLLIIDDNVAIHQDFLKIFGTTAEKSAEDEFLAAEAALFGEPVATASARPVFAIDSAYQGQEGVAKAGQALAEGRPYGMAFVDMRMPPGWDGLETIERLWAIDPHIQVVITPISFWCSESRSSRSRYSSARIR